MTSKDRGLAALDVIMLRRLANEALDYIEGLESANAELLTALREIAEYKDYGSLANARARAAIAKYSEAQP
jgi:hypothetical protein